MAAAPPSAFLQHFEDATLPVVKVCLLGAVGAILARAGILDQPGRRVLSQLIFTLFTPALSFAKLAPVLSVARLVSWSPIALNMIISVTVGLLLGVLLRAAVRPPAALRPHVLAATALGNAGNLPLVLVAALIRECNGAVFPGETVSEDRAIAYVALGLMAATLTHFSIGTHLLELPPEQQQQQQQQQQALDGSSSVAGKQLLPLATRSPHHAAAQQQPRQHHSCSEPGSSGASSRDGCFTAVELSAAGSAASKAPDSQAHQRQQPTAVQVHAVAGPWLASGSGCSRCCALCGAERDSSAGGSAGGRAGGRSAWRCATCRCDQPDSQHATSLTADSSERDRLLAAGGPSNSSGGGGSGGTSSIGSRGAARTAGRWLGRAAAGTASVLRTPPMLGCLLAIAVGLVPPLQRELFDASTGHLLMLTDCIEMFASCCIPSLLLMLGATLAKGPGPGCPPLRVVLGVGAARLVVLPLLGVGWLLAALKLGLLVVPDRTFMLVMLIGNSVPTALNVHTLCVLAANQEAAMGALLFYEYLAACVSLPCALTFYLWLLNRLAI